MADKLMLFPNNNTQNCPFCISQLLVETLDTQLNKPTNQNSLKVPNVVKPTNKKRYYKTLETSVINSPLAPLSLWYKGKNCTVINIEFEHD